MDTNKNVIIEDPGEEAALFTDTGRVFYDLKALCLQYLEAAKPVVEAFDESTPETERWMMMGCIQMIMAIDGSAEVLRLDHEFAQS